MAILDSIECPKCRKIIRSADYCPNARGSAPVATSYYRCLRRCESCGIGFSNAKRKPIAIYKDPIENVPPEVCAEAKETLSLSLNARNRLNKLRKFGFETSEDAVTWTIFQYLHEHGQIGQTFARLVGPMAPNFSREPTVLLWGAPVPTNSKSGNALRSHLINISENLCENPDSRTEPDVVLDFGEGGFVFIEVKYLSGNDIVESDRSYRFKRYLDSSKAFSDRERVSKSGYYELARNWRIGWEMAELRPFCLINLVPSNLVGSRKQKLALDVFSEGLQVDNRHQFLLVTWPDFLRSIPKPWPIWLDRYLWNRKLVT